MNRILRNGNPPTAAHRGVALVTTIICLGVIVAMLAVAMQTSLKQQRMLDRQLQMEQTRWLANAVAARAPQYLAGETSKTIQIKFDRYPIAEVGLQRVNPTIGEESGSVKIEARIGPPNRPELQTRHFAIANFNSIPASPKEQK